ncbi:hypothetical protein HK101_002523, partial [Irineochytrium annulatum]
GQQLQSPAEQAPPVVPQRNHFGIDLNRPAPSRSRRQGGPPADDGEVFVVVFVFNYGIGLDIYVPAAQDHARPGVSIYFDNVVHSTSSLVDAIAPKRFPELLRKHGEAIAPQVTQLPDSNGTNTATRLIHPSLIVAQSSIWELYYWRKFQVERLGISGTDQAEVEAATRWGFARLENDLKSTYFPAFRDYFPASPLAWRTSPPAGVEYKFPHAVADYNRYMVEFGRREGLRVLDWERIVEGRMWTMDSHHQNVEGTLSFSQMMLAELESLHG